MKKDADSPSKKSIPADGGDSGPALRRQNPTKQRCASVLAPRSEAKSLALGSKTLFQRTAKADAELVAEIIHSATAAGTQEAFATLMHRYWKVVVILARSRLPSDRDAEDVAQEAFTRAFLSLGKLQNPKLFLGWLLRIAGNLAIDHMRRRRPEPSFESLGISEIDAARKRGSALEEAHMHLEQQEELKLAMEALPSLSDRYRTVLTLRYLKGLSNQEMAAALGEPEGTIRNRLFRALDKLRKVIDQRRASKT